MEQREVIIDLAVSIHAPLARSNPDGQSLAA